MYRCVEPPLAPALGRLAVAWVFFDVRDQPRIEDRLAIRLGIEPPVEIEIRARELQPCQPGHPPERFETLRKQNRIRGIDRRHRQGSQYIAVVVNDRDDLFALLVLVAGIADAVPAFFGHRVGAITMEHAEIKLVVVREMCHAGDEGLLQGAVVGPPGEDFVDRCVMDGSVTLGVCGHGQALPLHPCISTYTEIFLYPSLEFAQCRMLWDDNLLRHGSRHKNGLRAASTAAGVPRRCDSSKG
jgi:hypothetical protein